jgi:hypothetical protein
LLCHVCRNRRCQSKLLLLQTYRPSLSSLHWRFLALLWCAWLIWYILRYQNQGETLFRWKGWFWSSRMDR